VVIIKNEQIRNIPLLHVFKAAGDNQKLPLIFFLHGVRSAKENNLHYAYFLAEKGFRVILPEALYHGERDEGFLENKLLTHFWEIVITSIHEINILKEYYVGKDLADPEKLGVVGTSMGGITTFGALTQYPWIKTAVSLMGMPTYEKFSLWQLEQIKKSGVPVPFSHEEIAKQLLILNEYDMSIKPERLDNRPLLFWHAKNDPIVPYDLTYQFFESIREDYKLNPGKLKFISDENAGHKVTSAGVKATVDWFEKFLL
jgi:uncharacterized protein